MAGQGGGALGIVQALRDNGTLKPRGAASAIVTLVDGQRGSHFLAPFADSQQEPGRRFIPANEREKYRRAAARPGAPGKLLAEYVPQGAENCQDAAAQEAHSAFRRHLKQMRPA